jgi:hypothetical protein
MHTNKTSQRVPESQADAPRAKACVVRITSGSLPILSRRLAYVFNDLGMELYVLD